MPIDRAKIEKLIDADYSKVKSAGGMTETVLDIRMIFYTALKGLATCLILAHYRSSGNLKQSLSNLNPTQKIKDAGKFLDIQVLDHIILDAEDQFYSLTDNGDI